MVRPPLVEAQLMRRLQNRVAWLTSQADPNQPNSEDLIRQTIIDVAHKLGRPGWTSYLVGGTLRDLLVGTDENHPAFHPRDVDIIVSGATSEQLRPLLRETLTLERLTRFGGLHLSKKLPNGARILFDIWTLADTWGFHSQNITPRIEDFPGTTFLNIDSCAIELLRPNGEQRRVYARGFFEGVARCVLDLNYAPNPYPCVCAARALVLAARLNFTMTRPLAEFILQHTAAAGGVPALLEAQQSHYGMVRSGAAELETWLSDIRQQFGSNQQNIGIHVSAARRLELSLDYPGPSGLFRN